MNQRTRRVIGIIPALACLLLSGCGSGAPEPYTGSVAPLIECSATDKYLGGWSPDGQWIVFGEQIAEKEFRLAKVNAESGVVVTLCRASDMLTCPVWSPKDDRIAYGLSGDIWTIRADGTQRTRLTRSGELGGYMTWSAEGDRIYVCLPDEEAGYRIMEVDAATGATTEILSDDYPGILAIHRPIPGGGLLAWGFSAKGVLIFEIDLASGKTNEIIYPPMGIARKEIEEWLTSPDPSPDGRYIVYQEGINAEGGFHLVRPDGSDETLLLTKEDLVAEGTSLGGNTPIWSPKYDVIAFVVALYDPEHVLRGISLFRFDEASLERLLSESGE